jgi:hypothetical protein
MQAHYALENHWKGKLFHGYPNINYSIVKSLPEFHSVTKMANGKFMMLRPNITLQEERQYLIMRRSLFLMRQEPEVQT